MRSGGLRWLVDFISEDGQHVMGRRADIRGLTAREMIAEEEFIGEDLRRVRIRWDSETALIRPRWKLTCGGDVFHVRTIADPSGRSRELVLIVARRQ